MNSKRRCTMCKDYYDIHAPGSQSVGLSGVCSVECLLDLKEKARNKRARRIVHRENRIRYGRRLDPVVREAVRERDNHRCKYCGKGGDFLEIHHVNYRSQGGPDEAWNLILLCRDHHQLMHTSKKKWQPLCRWVLYSYYFEAKRYTVPQMERMMGAE